MEVQTGREEASQGITPGWGHTGPFARITRTTGLGPNSDLELTVLKK